jgi:hypothetical protein
MEVRERFVPGQRWSPRIRRSVLAASFMTFSVIGMGSAVASATRLNTRSSTTTTTWSPPPYFKFCDAAAKWVGDYSVKVEWKLGLNDDRPLPIRMSDSIEETVVALANDSLSLAKLAPTHEIASTLKLLSSQLRSSALPIDVVRAEAAYGATGFNPLLQICPSSMMIMTSTNPLGGIQ